MTDPLTDAVRRLKSLQEDVERLKAGRDQEGEPRIFLTEQESVDVADVIDLGVVGPGFEILPGDTGSGLGGRLGVRCVCRVEHADVDVVGRCRVVVSHGSD